MFIRRFHDPIIAAIERRISMFTHIPVEHQEDIQVLRYSKGQKYGESTEGTGALGARRGGGLGRASRWQQTLGRIAKCVGAENDALALLRRAL